MNVLFEETNQNVETAFPYRLAAVMLCDVNRTNTEPYHLVVQSAQRKTGIKSVLLTEWSWSAEYLVIYPSHIVGPCFVISIKDDTSKILEALSLDKLPSEFTTPVDAEESSSSSGSDADDNFVDEEDGDDDSDDDDDDTSNSNNGADDTGFDVLTCSASMATQYLIIATIKNNPKPCRRHPVICEGCTLLFWATRHQET
jgi:hypothetical protein